MLGLVYMQQGKYDQAASTLQLAIGMEKSSSKPSRSTIYASLIGQGDTYRREKIYNQALAFLQEARGLMSPCSPGYQQLLVDKAQIYEGLSKLPEAEATFQKLVSYAKWAHSNELLYNYLTNLEEVQLQLTEYAKLTTTLERAYPYVVKRFGANSLQTIIFAKNI